MSTGHITSPKLQIRPSKKLSDYITSVQNSPETPVCIAKLILKNKVKNDEAKFKERQFLEVPKLNSKIDSTQLLLNDEAIILENDQLLSVEDLEWLYEYIKKDNETKAEKVFLHILIQGSRVILPKNSEIPRNSELEKRCERLKASQQNLEYSHMTKNVDSVRRKHPEDTISYQVQQMDRHLIAISQLTMSVLAGFAFGFIGVESLIGNLDFGFRLLLGIICALVIALAELYFLTKKLNRDMKVEAVAKVKTKLELRRQAYLLPDNAQSSDKKVKEFQ